ncbi:hypothetical protein KVT40_005939, partial [Elsinoe batatas]
RVKSELHRCEDIGLLTINILAAKAFLCFYEIGHGRYPVAYLTAGGCTRLALTLGLHDTKRAVQLTLRPNGWTEIEERRRIWWAAVVIDSKCVSIGFRLRPMSIPKLPTRAFVPADDDRFDLGQPAVSPVLVMSINSVIQVTSYAQTCQVVNLLGPVVDHINPSESNDPGIEYTYSEAMQLHRAATSLLTMVNDNYNMGDLRTKIRSSVPKALLYTALINLFFYHCAIEGDSIDLGGEESGIRAEFQQLALDNLGPLALDILNFGQDLTTMFTEHGMSWLSPLVIDCIFQASVYYAWRVREASEADSLEKLQALRSCLEILKQRWKNAGEYLRMSEETEYEWK